MCGISAIICQSQARDLLPLILPMNSSIRHRGPDDEGFLLYSGEVGRRPLIFGGHDSPLQLYATEYPYSPSNCIDAQVDLESRVAFGHRRLSIVDLSPAGHQPMCDSQGRYWIIFNGEIYNFQDIRDELSDSNFKFYSHTDTEVILAAYALWGRDCLQKFNGMWSFVILDTRKNSIFAARDRFGIKPFYYWFSPEGFLAIGSEIKQFTMLPGWSARLNPQRAYDYLIHGIADHTNQTLFRDVYQIRGGEAFEVNLNEIRNPLPVYRWYNFTNHPFPGSLEMAAEKFRSLLYNSINLRLRADVPVGSCLSGGLDSSSIVCIANILLQQLNSKSMQETFSACSRFKEYDERDYIEAVVNQTKIKAHYIYPENCDLFRELENLVWYQDEPFGSTSIYAQWNVFRMASEHNVKVLLDGQGADEMLAGYHHFFPAHYAGLLQKLKIFSFLDEISAVNRIHGYSIQDDLKKVIYNLLPKYIRSKLGLFRNNSYVSPSWLNIKKLGAFPSLPPFPEKKYMDLLNDHCYLQLTQTSLPLLLHWEDRDSMAFSVEARVPFLDYRLVEFVVGLPPDLKIERGITKKVLRESLKSILPEKIVTRYDKLGFATPEEYWVRSENTSDWKKALSDAIENSAGIIKPEALKKFDRVVNGYEPFSFSIWRMICFSTWMKIFNVKVEEPFMGRNP